MFTKNSHDMNTTKITSSFLLRTLACLLTAWMSLGCERETAVDFSLLYPSAAKPVYLIGKPFRWTASAAGSSTFELLQGNNVVFSQNLTGTSITPQLTMTSGNAYTMRLTQGNSTVSLGFTATSVDSLLGNPQFGGSYRYIETDPAGNTTVQYLTDSISVIANPLALECVVESPWLTSPNVQIEQVTDSMILFDTLFVYALHSHFSITAEINFLRHTMACELSAGENRTSRVVEFSSN